MADHEFIDLTACSRVHILCRELLPMRLFAIAALLALAAPAAASDGFRCPATGNLIPVGATRHEVRSRCRAPDDALATIETRLVERTVRRSVARPLDAPRRAIEAVEVDETITVAVDVHVEWWTYDFGPRRFLRVLRFEDGRLVSVVDGPRGSPAGSAG